MANFYDRLCNAVIRNNKPNNDGKTFKNLNNLLIAYGDTNESNIICDLELDDNEARILNKMCSNYTYSKDWNRSFFIKNFSPNEEKNVLSKLLIMNYLYNSDSMNKNDFIKALNNKYFSLYEKLLNDPSYSSYFFFSLMSDDSKKDLNFAYTVVNVDGNLLESFGNNIKVNNEIVESALCNSDSKFLVLDAVDNSIKENFKFGLKIVSILKEEYNVEEIYKKLFRKDEAGSYINSYVEKWFHNSDFIYLFLTQNNEFKSLCENKNEGKKLTKKRKR